MTAIRVTEAGNELQGNAGSWGGERHSIKDHVDMAQWGGGDQEGHFITDPVDMGTEGARVC